MLITNPCVVSLTWRLEDAQGQLIDELADPVEFFVGGEDLFTRVEEELQGKQPGDELDLRLEPEDAFGDYDSKLVFFEERGLFPKNTAPGMQFDGPPEGATTVGMPGDVIYTVTEVYDTHVVLDGNHPLAGIALQITLKVCDVRAASEQEIEQGSVSDAVFTVLHTAPAGGNVH